MSVVFRMDMPEGCVYKNKDGETEYCPLCDHTDVPFCMFIVHNGGLSELGFGARPWGCPIAMDLDEGDIEVLEYRRQHR